MTPEVRLTCPLGAQCEEIRDGAIHRCVWFTQLQGTNPQTGDRVDERGCAMVWLPILLIENAQQARSTSTPERAQTWLAANGSIGLRWNRDLAGDIGMRITAGAGLLAAPGWDNHEMFELQTSDSLEFDVRNGNLRAFLGGALQARGGHVIESRSGRIDLTDFRLVPRVGSAVPILDLVGADGTAWFYVDRLMYRLATDGTVLQVPTMDLRITPELARRLGHPEVADWAIADMTMDTQVLRQGQFEQPQTTGKWHGAPVPGVPGATYQADLFMTTFNTQYMRCLGCSGAGGNGQVVFAPSSTLRNNVNNGSFQAVVPGDPLGTSTALYTANIPWYQKFSGNFAPYGNDQHPYLIWNLYRYNADGSIDQIGRSGVKHAFLTINTNCLENPGSSQILGRGCADVYSTGNNDSNNSLGPRSEIIPATNQWGRCGSVYDLNCDGIQNQSGYGAYDQRLVVRESQFSGPAHAGATYRFESWYLAREDINIMNSMASTNATFSRPSTVWVVGGQTGAAGDYRLGPAIDRWVNPAAPGSNARSVLLKRPEGQARVAMRVIDLGGGQWRYHYAVMNLDFARAVTTGAEPNLRVISNHGFDHFSVPVGISTITDLVFSDGDVDAANDWVPTIADGRLTWTAPTLAQSLNWGTMFRFSFTANQPPIRGVPNLHIAGTNPRGLIEILGVLTPAAQQPVLSGGR
jgi:hypothetical protein